MVSERTLNIIKSAANRQNEKIEKILESLSQDDQVLLFSYLCHAVMTEYMNQYRYETISIADLKRAMGTLVLRHAKNYGDDYTEEGINKKYPIDE